MSARILVQPDAGIKPVRPTHPLTEKTGQRILAALGGSPTASTDASEPKFAQINASTSGDNTIVAAVTGKKIRVLQYVLIAAGAVNARWQSAAAGSYLSGALPLAAQAGASAAFGGGLFETAAGELLNLELSAAIQVSGHLTYVEV